MAQVKVEVCLGTTCYVLGSQKIVDAINEYPEELKANIKLIGCRCLGMCHEGNYGDAPYVRINDVPMSGVDLTKVREEIEAKIKEAPAQ